MRFLCVRLCVWLWNVECFLEFLFDFIDDIEILFFIFKVGEVRIDKGVVVWGGCGMLVKFLYKFLFLFRNCFLMIFLLLMYLMSFVREFLLFKLFRVWNKVSCFLVNGFILWCESGGIFFDFGILNFDFCFGFFS